MFHSLQVVKLRFQRKSLRIHHLLFNIVCVVLSTQRHHTPISVHKKCWESFRKILSFLRVINYSCFDTRKREVLNIPMITITTDANKVKTFRKRFGKRCCRHQYGELRTSLKRSRNVFHFICCDRNFYHYCWLYAGLRNFSRTGNFLSLLALIENSNWKQKFSLV